MELQYIKRVKAALLTPAKDKKQANFKLTNSPMESGGVYMTNTTYVLYVIDL